MLYFSELGIFNSVQHFSFKYLQNVVHIPPPETAHISAQSY